MEEFGIVVFGATVRPDGAPSGSLARRISYGLRAAKDHPRAPILCSGAAKHSGPSEAAVIAAGLKGHGISEERLTLDEASQDTFETVIATAIFVRQYELSGCIACSERYHLPRIRLLLAVFGVTAVSGPVGLRSEHAPIRLSFKMHAREAAAIPYDLALALIRRRRILRQVTCDPARLDS